MQLLYRLITGHFSGGHKVFLLILLTAIEIHTINSQRSCYQCEGVNCLRTTYSKVETCSDGLDICVTVFDGQTVQAQGCLENLDDDLRVKCDSDDAESMTECHKCNGNLCNNMAASSFECVQCDSTTDSNCYDNAELLKPVRCPISRTSNQYCYAQKDGNRVVRGCTSTLEQQATCLASEECIVCDPSAVSSCNTRRATEDNNTSSSSSPTDSSSSSSSTTTTTTTENPGPSGSGSVYSFALTNYLVLLFACVIKFY